MRRSDISDVRVRPAPESMMMVVSLEYIALSGTDAKKSNLTSSTSLSFDGDSSVGYIGWERSMTEEAGRGRVGGENTSWVSASSSEA